MKVNRFGSERNTVSLSKDVNFGTPWWRWRRLFLTLRRILGLRWLERHGNVEPWAGRSFRRSVKQLQLEAMWQSIGLWDLVDRHGHDAWGLFWEIKWKLSIGVRLYEDLIPGGFYKSNMKDMELLALYYCCYGLWWCLKLHSDIHWNTHKTRILLGKHTTSTTVGLLRFI